MFPARAAREAQSISFCPQAGTLDGGTASAMATRGELSARSSSVSTRAVRAGDRAQRDGSARARRPAL